MAYPLKTIIAVTLSVAVLTAFKQPATPPAAPAPLIDTVPAPKAPAGSRIDDFEDARRQLRKAAADLEKQLRDFEMPDLKAQMAEVEKAMKEVDIAQIKAEAAKAAKAVDAEKAIQQAQAELAKIDAAAIRKQVEESMKKVEVELQATQAQMVKLQKEELAKVAQELKAMKPKMEAEMDKARAEIAKAEKEIDAYDNFINDLAADGLLNKQGYTVEHKDGKLFIDGKEQPEAVYNKYRSFLEAHKNVKITKDGDGLNIRN